MVKGGRQWGGEGKYKISYLSFCQVTALNKTPTIFYNHYLVKDKAF